MRTQSRENKQNGKQHTTTQMLIHSNREVQKDAQTHKHTNWLMFKEEIANLRIILKKNGVPMCNHNQEKGFF